MPRVVLLASDGDSTRIVFHALQPQAVVLENHLSSLALLRRRRRRYGLRKVLGQLAFRTTVVPLLSATSKGRVREILAQDSLSIAPIPESVVTHVHSVNDDETITRLRELQPSVVVVNGTRIISPRLLSSVAVPFINTHVGITPLYRGVHGGYWALATGDNAHCGVTVHLVDQGIDTGSILFQASIAPTASDNFVTYPYLQIAAAIPLLKQAIQDALVGSSDRQPAPPGHSRLWTHPTLFEYMKLRTRGIR